MRRAMGSLKMTNQYGHRRPMFRYLSRLCVAIALLLQLIHARAAPQEIAPFTGWANWWHLDRMYPSAQQFCNAIHAAHSGGHVLHPAPAGCMDTGMYYPRVVTLPGSLLAELPWGADPIYPARCTPMAVPEPRTPACPSISLDVYTRHESYCPLGYLMQGSAASSGPMSAYWQQFPPETDFYRLLGYDNILSGSYLGGSPKCVAYQPNQIDENKNTESSTCSMSGNPIHTSLGRKKQVEVDYRDKGGLLTFERHYWSALLLGDAVAQRLAGYGPRLGSMPRWRIGFQQMVHLFEGGPISTTWAVRNDGRSFAFNASGGAWTGEADVLGQLSEIRDVGNARIGWKFSDSSSRRIEVYDVVGKLSSISRENGGSVTLTYSTAATPVSVAPWTDLVIAVADNFGRQLSFQYDARGRLSKLIDPAGGEYVYVYDEASSVVLPGQRLANNLTSVKYPGGLKRLYSYNEQEHTANSNLSNALTGISDETAPGQFVRYAIYKYDNQGRAISTEHAGGVNRYSVNYVVYGQQSVTTDPLGTQRTHNFATILGISKQTSQSQPAGSGCGPSSSAITYDTQANVSSRTDFNNNKICYAYDLSRNLETKRVEGLPASSDCATALSLPPAGSRIISTQWHPDWRLETRIAEPKKLTTITYNGQGATCAPSTVLVDGKPPAVVCTRTERATTDETGAAGFAATVTGTARTWRYTYTTYGRVLTATDPNNRVTSYSYHPDNDADLGKRGNVASITNAANHTTFITDYNPHSQPTRIVDPNGVVTVLTYDPRMRLTSRTVGNEATVFGYDPVGQMISVNLPDGARLTYTYDAAHRLTAIADHKGNRIDYTLDAMGNRINEQMKDPAGVLVGNIARVIDALNRVQQVTGAAQ